MGTTYRFIEEPAKPSKVLTWFRALPQPPTEVSTEHGVVLYFRELGSLVYDTDGKVDSRKSPVANIFLPRVRRGVLWTVGEVHFLTTPLRQLFPRLHTVSSGFSRWLTTHRCIFTSTNTGNAYDYYLEGSARNFDVPIFAFDSGLDALRAGRYFVSAHDNDFVLDKLCRALGHRGIECAKA